MKIYLAGNAPDRFNEEKELLFRDLTNNRLVSFYYMVMDTTLDAVLKLWGIKKWK